jgi:hypothetical protein
LELQKEEDQDWWNWMTSSRKKDSNKRNATKSTGPKTESGKRRVRLNALKHGFYAHELTVSEADKRDFEMLRESLRVQLAPRTALQDVGFEQIVACCWRCKLAIRMEMLGLKTLLIAKDALMSDDTAPQRDIRETQWYGASKVDLRYGVGILKELREDISAHGSLHLESWRDQIIKAFGLGFYDALCEWKDMNIDAMYVAEHLQKHAATFKAPLPVSSRPPEGVEIIADPKQKLQMLIKLVDLQTQHLADLQHISSVASQTRESALNGFAPRYFATGSRDLQRAVDWYLYLRSNNL